MKPQLRIVQPVDTGRESGWSTIYRPGAWFFYAGRFYVGYGILSGFHQGETPMWDPQSVPVGAIVDTCGGEYRFVRVLTEGPPYFRTYAVLASRYYYRPHDYGNGFLRKPRSQGRIEMREQFVLPSGCYFEHQWLAGPAEYPFFPLYHVREEMEYQKVQRRMYREAKKKALPLPQDSLRKHKAFHSFVGSECNLTHKWNGDGLSEGRNLERKILRCKSLDSLRFGKEVEEFRAREHPKGCLRCGS